MNIAVVGSRSFTNYDFVRSKLDYLFQNISEPITIVSGGAIGVDTLASLYRVERDLGYIEHLPDYLNNPAKLAPIIRNTLIVNDADLLVAFQKEDSRGTQDAINKAKQKGIPVRIIKV